MKDISVHGQTQAEDACLFFLRELKIAVSNWYVHQKSKGTFHLCGIVLVFGHSYLHFSNLSRHFLSGTLTTSAKDVYYDNRIDDYNQDKESARF